MITVDAFYSRIAQAIVAPSDVDIPTSSVDFTAVLSYVFTLAGAIAVIVIAIAGFQYVVSRGDPAGTAKAKNAIIYAVIGLVVCIMAFSIVRFVIGRV